MKILVGSDAGSYTMNPAGNTITITGVTVTLDQVLLITDVSQNIIIYNFADPALGGTMNNGVLTLDYNIGSLNANDRLQVFVEQADPTSDQLVLLRRMVKLMESQATVDASNRQRVAVEAMPSITVSSAPTTAVTLASAPTTTIVTGGTAGSVTQNSSAANPYALSSISALTTNEGPVDQRWRIVDAARTAFAVGIRANLVFS